MKYLSIFVLLVSFPAFSAAKKEVLKLTASVSVHELRCVIALGNSSLPVEQRMKTQLGSQDGSELRIFGLDKNQAELSHKIAVLKNCDITKLDQIVSDSLMSFGFLHDAELEVVKETSESRLNGFNQCVANYSETLKINLGEGIIVSSHKGELRKANDCQKN